MEREILEAIYLSSLPSLVLLLRNNLDHKKYAPFSLPTYTHPLTSLHIRTLTFSLF